MCQDSSMKSAGEPMKESAAMTQMGNAILRNPPGRRRVPTVQQMLERNRDQLLRQVMWYSEKLRTLDPKTLQMSTVDYHNQITLNPPHEEDSDFPF